MVYLPGGKSKFSRLLERANVLVLSIMGNVLSKLI